MVADTAARPSMTSLAALAAEPHAFVTCPNCRTPEPTVTNAAASAGAVWRCTQCLQRWSADRLATVAAYSLWLRERTSRSDAHTTIGSGDK